MCPRSFYLTVLTLLTFILSSILDFPFGHFFFAQNFRPRPSGYACSVFVEGKGLYIFGGRNDVDFLYQVFLIDFSVPWSTRDSVFKQLSESPVSVMSSTCTLLTNGKDIFVMVIGIGYIYDTLSDSWRSLNIDFPIGYQIAVSTDLETGLVYILRDARSAGWKLELTELNMETRTTNITATPLFELDASTTHYTWSASLRSFILPPAAPDILYIFTPSKVTGSSNGWSTMNATCGGLFVMERSSPRMVVQEWSSLTPMAIALLCAPWIRLP